MKKFTNAVDAIQFKKLKKLEKEISFDEKANRAKNFFRKGIVDEWKSVLPKSIANNIKKNFEEEMRDLNYD